jgi:GH15 family glucan-1,4-alpha-glucosidase
MSLGYQPIENYGVIGDLHTVALVGMDGSIDFMCFPEFNSPSVFAALLDREMGGFFRLAPLFEAERRKQLYLPDTNMLLTRFLSSAGVAEVSDFMPVEDVGAAHCVIRRVKTVRGEVRYRMICAPRFDYARSTHKVDRRSEHEVIFVPDTSAVGALRLHSSVPVRVENGDVVAEFNLGAGGSADFILEEARPKQDSPSGVADAVSRYFKDTMNFWRRWVSRSTYRGRWQEIVNRSALTLKLLTSQQYGSIVASPTFGLPETLGGGRNWDYRYTWIRDASFTLYGLMRLGYTDEAAAFMRWFEDRCKDQNPDGSLQIMYGIDGRKELPEETLTHLEGYMRSSPVRIGNGAAGQLQLDIYGELMDSVYLYDKYGEPISYDLWMNLVRLIDWVADHWQLADEGIWEVRGGRREFLFSRVMCWAALDRAVRLSQKRSFPGPVERWRAVRDTIYAQIFTEFWDPERKAFVQSRGSRWLDASTLLMPLVRFISPVDPRWLSTLRAIERELVDDSLVYRYSTGDHRVDAIDGLVGKEGTFSMCSFWYVECLSRSGDLPQARFVFEKILGYANHLGLYAEELGPTGEHLGNYPQAFTHLALISAAYDLNRRVSAGRFA